MKKAMVAIGLSMLSIPALTGGCKDEGGAKSSCDEAGEAARKGYLAAIPADAPEASKKDRLDFSKEIAGRTTKQCTDGKWSNEAIACVTAKGSTADCMDHLTPEQQRANRTEGIELTPEQTANPLGAPAEAPAEKSTTP